MNSFEIIIHFLGKVAEKDFAENASISVNQLTPRQIDLISDYLWKYYPRLTTTVWDKTNGTMQIVIGKKINKHGTGKP